MVAAGDILTSLTKDANFTHQLEGFLDSLPNLSGTLEILASRVAVMVPLEEVLVEEYSTNLNLSAPSLNATRYLLVDVNRVSLCHNIY